LTHQKLSQMHGFLWRTRFGLCWPDTNTQSGTLPENRNHEKRLSSVDFPQLLC